MQLTTSINCTTNSSDAYMQMKMVYEQFSRRKYDEPVKKRGKSSVKAIHYIMSFADEENVTPEQAHKIAKAFVRKSFGDDAQAVISTHVDASHIHCHIVLNSYAVTGQRYYDNQETLRTVRETANGVCKTLGVTPFLNFENKGRSLKYYEWHHRKNGTSWKAQIKNEIDKLIGSVKTLDELLQLLEENGYEVKLGKYISVRAPGQERFVRTKTLGEEYTEESLITRILYREVGSGETPSYENKEKLWADYAAVIGDVRILAGQQRKVQRKYDTALPYSEDNDLDVHRLSAQLSVLNQEKIYSIGELEGRIFKLKRELEKQRVLINEQIDEHNRLISLLQQAEEYFELSKKSDLSAPEELKKKLYEAVVHENGLYSAAAIDRLKNKADILSKKISALKENLESCRQQYDVYTDIYRSYGEISKDSYIDDLIEEENKNRAQKHNRSR